MDTLLDRLGLVDQVLIPGPDHLFQAILEPLIDPGAFLDL
jgi:hypothetical protein